MSKLYEEAIIKISHLNYKQLIELEKDVTDLKKEKYYEEHYEKICKSYGKFDETMETFTDIYTHANTPYKDFIIAELNRYQETNFGHNDIADLPFKNKVLNIIKQHQNMKMFMNINDEPF